MDSAFFYASEYVTKNSFQVQTFTTLLFTPNAYTISILNLGMTPKTLTVLPTAFGQPFPPGLVTGYTFPRCLHPVYLRLPRRILATDLQLLIRLGLQDSRSSRRLLCPQPYFCLRSSWVTLYSTWPVFYTNR